MQRAGRKIIVGVSGASGAIYARRLIEVLAKAEHEIHLIVTDPARGVIREELGIEQIDAVNLIGAEYEKMYLHANDNMFNCLASGSTAMDAMIICPCSSHSLAAIAAGLADSLLLRSAYVSLKQRRPLVLVHREMPLTAIDLENMLKVTRAGAIVCPAAPVFYHRPKGIDDLVDSVVGRVLELAGLDHSLGIRYET